MFTTLRRAIPIALCSLPLVLAAPLTAQQAPDLQTEVRQRQEIERQRIEKEVRESRELAYRALRISPQKAVATLQDLINQLEKDTVLPEARRAELIRVLKGDIGGIEALVRVRRSTDATVRATHDDIRRSQDPRINPDQRSVYNTAAQRINSMNGRVSEIRSNRVQTGDRFTGALVQVDKAAVPAASDYELPADWVEKSKKRSPQNKLTAQERAILEALNKPIAVDFNMDTFQSVIDYFSKAMNQTLLVDKQALDEANVTYDTPVTLRFNRPVSTRTALKRVLADLGLTYIIRKEMIQVTTIARARETLSVRTYYIGDLLGTANPILPAIVNDFQMIQTIGMILSNITSIEPESWEGRGGAGTVIYDPIRMALVVKQTAEVHYMLGGGH
jgi:hypothetical protein